MRENIKEYSLKALKEKMLTLNLEAYRGEQVFKWLWQKDADDFTVMTNLSKELRKLFAGIFFIPELKILKVLSAEDGSKKFLFQLEDDEKIEAVFIPEAKRKTVCVSTQVGCPLQCRFCATALMGFIRNLEAYEIAEQIRLIQKQIKEKITNIVFMGMGEPLLNFENLIAAIEITSSPLALGISQRHTTISTAGLTDGIRRLLNSPYKVKLAISLNFPDQKQRSKMMPINKKFPLSEILPLAKDYSIKKNMVTFEYVLIDKINDRIKDAQKLLDLLKGIPSKINLIPYNPHPRLPYKRPTPEKIDKFHQYLLRSHHTITMRKSRGQKILAGCGQLALS